MYIFKIFIKIIGIKCFCCKKVWKDWRLEKSWKYYTLCLCISWSKFQYICV